MKKLISKISFGAILSLIPMVAGAVSTGFNSARECYVDADGNNWYWFCGIQSHSCKGSTPSGSNRVFDQIHGGHLDYGDSGSWWCCVKDSTKSGVYVEGQEWSKTEEVTETIYDTDGNAIGKCTWKRETSVCGVENPQDKCTEATGECEQGYVSHNGKCVKACQTGYAFASETDNNCVKVDKNNPTQGTKGGSIVQCEENEFYDKKTLGCIPQTERIQVSTMAFTQCWKCDSPYLLKPCLLDYSKNGTISANTRSACGITQRTSEQKTFVDSGDATTSGTAIATNSSGNSGSGNNGGAVDEQKMCESAQDGSIGVCGTKSPYSGDIYSIPKNS